MSKNDDTVINQAFELLQGESGEQAANQINEGIARAVAEFTGEGIAQVQSAVTLTQDEKNGIQKLLLQIFKRDVIPEYMVNPKLLGGFRVSVGDWKLDASLSFKITGLIDYLGGAKYE
jgi:F0F1-type ATP synthase delta subunit